MSFVYFSMRFVFLPPIISASANSHDALTLLCLEMESLGKLCAWPAGCAEDRDDPETMCFNHCQILKHGICKHEGCTRSAVGFGQKLCIAHGCCVSTLPNTISRFRRPSKLPVISEVEDHKPNLLRAGSKPVMESQGIFLAEGDWQPPLLDSLESILVFNSEIVLQEDSLEIAGNMSEIAGNMSPSDP